MSEKLDIQLTPDKKGVIADLDNGICFEFCREGIRLWKDMEQEYKDAFFLPAKSAVNLVAALEVIMSIADERGESK